MSELRDRATPLDRAGGVLQRWIGVLLSLIGVVAMLWLGLSGKLELYIHPRYVVFTMVMAVVGGVLAVATFFVVPAADHHDHDHDHDHEHDALEGRSPSRRSGRALSLLGAVALVTATAVAMLVLPPATLSSATATNRDVTSSSTVLDAAETEQLVGGDPSSFTVKDWATLLRQGLDSSYFIDKPAAFSGFVVASDDPDVYYVARFMVTCCAVDAQPFGVPVFEPGWSDRLEPDAWVEVTGSFDDHPSTGASEPIVLMPDSVEPIDEPDQPYVY